MGIAELWAEKIWIHTVYIHRRAESENLQKVDQNFKLNSCTYHFAYLTSMNLASASEAAACSSGSGYLFWLLHTDTNRGRSSASRLVPGMCTHTCTSRSSVRQGNTKCEVCETSRHWGAPTPNLPPTPAYSDASYFTVGINHRWISI